MERRDDESASRPGAPLFVRIGGLPASVMDAFASDLCARLAAERQLEEELGEVRKAMVEGLFAAVHGAEPERRRYLLAVKRDCFNGRPLRRRVGHPSWREVPDLVGPVAERLLELEERLDAARRETAAAYEEQSAREQDALAAAADPRFLRGLALASPVLAEQSRRLTRPGKRTPAGRKQRKLALSLARYVSRAALKLSPFSTLTPVALGTCREDGAEGDLRLAADPWAERSLFRLKQFLPRLWEQVLRLHRPFRGRLRVTLNSSLEEVRPGSFRLLRPADHRLDEEAGRLRYREESLVHLKLGGPLIDWLRRELPSRDLTLDELVAALEAEFGAGEVEEPLVQLLDAGLLTALPPWPANEPVLEERILDALRSLPPDSARTLLVGTLDRLTEEARGYENGDDPAGAVRSVEDLLEVAWRQVTPLGDLPSGLERPGSRLRRGFSYEDVLLEPGAGEGPWRELIHLPREVLTELAASARPLVRLSSLLSSRLDFSHAVAEMIRRLRPGGGEVSFLDLFGAAQPLWQAYVQHELATGTPGRSKPPFDPFGLAEVAELARLRDAVLAELPGCVESRDGESRVDRQRFEEILDGVPAAYRPPVGGCLAVQPADPEGETWVLNRLYEGTGRMGSRFTPLLDESVRRRYTEHLARRSHFTDGGGEVELFDLFAVHDNLNVHAIQTPRVLELPGEHLELPPERRLTLPELRLSIDGETGLPRLQDRSGRRLLPVHLGVATQEHMPVLIKFLAALGPGDLRAIYPTTTFRRHDGVVIRERLTLDRLVLHRRRWSIPRERLPAGLEDLSEPGAFDRIHRWRRALGLPERVFVIEKRRHEVAGEIYKPQFLDLSSPHFVLLLRSLLEAEEPTLILEEMLPQPHAYPRDTVGRRWALEVLVDEIALVP